MKQELTPLQWRLLRLKLKKMMRSDSVMRHSLGVERAIDSITCDIDREIFIGYYVKSFSVVKLSMMYYYDEWTIRKHLNRGVEQFANQWNRGSLIKDFLGK